MSYHRDSSIPGLYREFRREQRQGIAAGHTYSHPVGAAVTALRLARDEQAVQRAERQDRIRFRWEYEQYWDIDDLEPEEPWRSQTLERIQNGQYEVLYCVAEVPERCPHCGEVLWGTAQPRRWTHAASLGGIVLDVDDEWNYRREVERELAAEVGII